MIPPLAQIVEIPTSVTLVSGKDARNHLNRMLTLDISKDSFLSRKESLICDLNGRISSHQLHADLGEQILLFHHESISENLRTNLTSGICHGMRRYKFQVEMEQFVVCLFSVKIRKNC